ncbi:hypothetical protein C8J57DRAFT_1232835 [Mycena rebaudengoi]|nr:hypothetical protein C8J57DRAFT_1232835 [Mycena rebaudengoi]
MKLKLKLLLLFVGVTSTRVDDSDAATRVQFKPLKTAGNVQNISQGFIGFGIEMSSFTHLAGNEPSPDAINHTGDKQACRLHTNTTIDGPWLDAFKRFNAGTRYQANACGNLKDSEPILGEIGSAIGGGNCSPSPDLYGSLGDALWTPDFLLHAMVIGIKRVSIQQDTNFDISSWQPATTPGHPRHSGDFQIDPLTNATHPSIVGCAGYSAGKLTKFAVLDMRFWNSAGRPAAHVELANLDAEITRARVLRLTAPGGSSNLENISWAGKQWSAADNDGQEPEESNLAVVIAGDDQRANT